MDADEDGIVRLIGDASAQLERQKNVVFAGKDNFKAPRLKERPQPARDVKSVILLEAFAALRAFIEPAVTSVHDNGLDFVRMLDHVRPQLWLNGLSEVDSRDEKFPVLRNNWEAKPITHSVNDGFPALAAKLDLIPGVTELE